MHSQPRNKVSVNFPQEFPLVNHVLALFFRLNGTHLAELDLFFLFGHDWRER